MSFSFPKFPQPNAIDQDREWTAIFDCYDQRNDDCYYLVTLLESGREVERLFVRVWLWWAGDDWTGADMAARIRDEIHRVAVSGKSNTDYRGSLAGWLAGRKIDPSPGQGKQ